MSHRRLEVFRMQCANASDNRLINIALDEVQKAEYNEEGDIHLQCARIAAEEMERRGLDTSCLNEAHEDIEVA